MITDGAYSGEKNRAKAAEKNIALVTTVLVGREANNIAVDFVFTEDGQKLIQCPAGYARKSCNYIRQTGQCRLSFLRNKRLELLFYIKFSWFLVNVSY